MFEFGAFHNEPGCEWGGRWKDYGIQTPVNFRVARHLGAIANWRAGFIPSPVGGASATLAERSMNNRDDQVTWKYHDGTKHSYWSVHNDPHFLDWTNRPRLFKIYPTIEPFPLPRDVRQTGVAAISEIVHSSSRADTLPELQDLARILYFSAGNRRTGTSRGRILLSRCGLHRCSLRDRVVPRNEQSPEPGQWRVPLQSGGCITSPSEKR